MRNFKVFAFLLSFLAIASGFALSGCSKTEDEKSAESLSEHAEDAANAAEKDAAKLKEEAEKNLKK